MVKNIGKRIRKVREERGVSQKKLGMILGLSDKAISAYEAGRTYPPIDTLERIAKELGKPIEYFVTNDSDSVQASDAYERVEKLLESLTKAVDELKSSISNKK